MPGRVVFTLNEESLTILEELAEDHLWLRPLVAAMRERVLGEWQAEHTRLFISGYPTTACPPFASVQRHGAMGGDIVGELEMFYRKYGLQTEGMPADYLGSMLECAAILLDDQEVNNPRIHEFTDNYLKPSLNTFCTCLCTATDSPLYRVLSEQIRGATDVWE